MELGTVPRGKELDTTALYAAIGRFAVRFEHLMFAIGQGIELFLTVDGLKNHQVAFAVVADQTAEPLRKLYLAVAAAMRSPIGADRVLLEAAMGEIQKVIAERNDVLHRLWFVGWAPIGQPAPPEVQSLKLTRTKNGVDPKPRTLTAVEFDALTAQVDALAEVINTITYSVIQGIPLDANLCLNVDGAVRRK